MENTEKLAIGVVTSLCVLGIVAFGAMRERATPPTPRSSLAQGPATAGPLIDTISHGETVELGQYLIPGERTIFEFTADW